MRTGNDGRRTRRDLGSTFIEVRERLNFVRSESLRSRYRDEYWKIKVPRRVLERSELFSCSRTVSCFLLRDHIQL